MKRARKIGEAETESIADWARSASKADPAAIVELRKENERLRRRLTSEGANAEIIMQAVREVFADYTPPQIPTPPKQKKRAESEVAVLHVSDTQFGKVTRSYDSQIAAERIADLAARTVKCIDRHREYASVDEVHVYLGGDMIEGETIFPGQAHLIDESVLSQSVVSCPGALSKLLLVLAGHVDRVHVVGVPGNHGRYGSKHMGAHHATNFDTLVYRTLRLMTTGPEGFERPDSKRITWQVASGFYAVNDVAGHKHLIVHGHQIRGGFAGFPWYGVGKRASGWIDAIPERWDHLYFGHFHTYTSGSLNGRWFFANGTTESDNDYAREELSASGEPVQRLQFWNAKHGLVADRPIYLRDSRKSSRVRP